MNAIPKLDVVRDREYLDSLHDEPCLITGLRGSDQETVDPSHIGAFKGMKRGDNEVLQILHRFHALGHQIGEMTMWRKYIPDWLLREALRAYGREQYRAYVAERDRNAGSNAPPGNSSDAD